MTPGEFNHLGHLGFRYLVGENATDTHAMTMDMQHDLYSLVSPLIEKLLEDMNDELHRRVVVVQNKDLVEAGFLGFRARLRDHAGARPRAGAVRAALPALAIVARVSHGRRFSEAFTIRRIS